MEYGNDVKGELDLTKPMDSVEFSVEGHSVVFAQTEMLEGSIGSAVVTLQRGIGGRFWVALGTPKTMGDGEMHTLTGFEGDWIRAVVTTHDASAGKMGVSFGKREV